ncbi:MAG: bifunctional salicylyl-CoA 5-hydroxylase/oxidoreductase [Bradymonadaceae bacterium]
MNEPFDIRVIGGGPAGLYFAIQMKLRDPDHRVTVHERDERGNTYGWGVVFSEGTLQNLAEADPTSYDQITDTFAYWDDLQAYYRGECIRSSGHGYCGIARTALLEILARRAEELGVEIVYEDRVEDVSRFDGADLVVASDGINSDIREKHADKFQPDIDRRSNKFIWMGTQKAFDAFTFFFEETDDGWFVAHCYQFDDEYSTFIVECTDETWRAADLDEMSKADSVAFCEELFADHLGDHELETNNPHVTGPDAWRNFDRVHNEHWSFDNVVLLGDAAHTAHYSIGSGTTMAMEDAIGLADALDEEPDLPTALEEFEEHQRVEYLRLQSAARNSAEWFEHMDLKGDLAPDQFYYSLVTRSQRVWHEDLRVRDREWLEDYEEWFAEQQTGEAADEPVPPMFLPYQLRGMELKNRIIQSPMAMYSADDGLVDDFHLVHFGQRAMGGAAMVWTEMTCVTPEGRITPGCAGLWRDDQAEAWERIVDFVHGRTDTKFGLQLGHSGRKGSTKVGWEGYHEPLEEDNWEVCAPSPMAWKEENQIPRKMTHEGMDRIREAFVESAERGAEVGFDMLELHCAHGYLLSSFLSPLTNHRDDEFGGSLENRMRYPLQIVDAVREVWPDDRPMSVRISATDWKEGGNTVEEAVAMAEMFKAHDVDIIDVSSGMVVPDDEPVYGRMFQIPYAEQVRKEAEIPTMGVGNIYTPDHVNSIIASGRSDLALLARPHLWDPNWTHRAAAELDYDETEWPKPYLDGKAQLERLTDRAASQGLLGPI